MKRYISILASAVLLLSSCTDFLSEENATSYSVDYVYGSEDGLKLAVNALYAKQRYYANDTESSTMFALVRATDLVVTNGGTGNFYGIYDPKPKP